MVHSLHAQLQRAGHLWSVWLQKDEKQSQGASCIAVALHNWLSAICLQLSLLQDDCSEPGKCSSCTGGFGPDGKGGCTACKVRSAREGGPTKQRAANAGPCLPAAVPCPVLRMHSMSVPALSALRRAVLRLQIDPCTNCTTSLDTCEPLGCEFGFYFDAEKKACTPVRQGQGAGGRGQQASLCLAAGSTCGREGKLLVDTMFADSILSTSSWFLCATRCPPL